MESVLVYFLCLLVHIFNKCTINNNYTAVYGPLTCLVLAMATPLTAGVYFVEREASLNQQNTLCILNKIFGKIRESKSKKSLFCNPIYYLLVHFSSNEPKCWVAW